MIAGDYTWYMGCDPEAWCCMYAKLVLQAQGQLGPLCGLGLSPARWGEVGRPRRKGAWTAYVGFKAVRVRSTRFRASSDCWGGQSKRQDGLAHRDGSDMGRVRWSYFDLTA